MYSRYKSPCTLLTMYLLNKITKVVVGFSEYSILYSIKTYRIRLSSISIYIAEIGLKLEIFPIAKSQRPRVFAPVIAYS